MKVGEDGPGNGGGSPSASMKFYYFTLPEEITPEQVKQIQEIGDQPPLKSAIGPT